MTHSTRALLVIDPQNDYFPGGQYPLWNTDATLANIEQAIAAARKAGDLVIFIQHIADPALGVAPFFNAGTPGAAIHPRLLALAPDAPVVVKTHADSFIATSLEETLQAQGITELLLCGMMTQNCVTHTALSRNSDHYALTVLSDCCTTVDQMLHMIALHALSSRIKLATVGEVF